MTEEDNKMYPITFYVKHSTRDAVDKAAKLLEKKLCIPIKRGHVADVAMRIFCKKSIDVMIKDITSS